MFTLQKTYFEVLYKFLRKNEETFIRRKIMILSYKCFRRTVILGGMCQWRIPKMASWPMTVGGRSQRTIVLGAHALLSHDYYSGANCRISSCQNQTTHLTRGQLASSSHVFCSSSMFCQLTIVVEMMRSEKLSGDTLSTDNLWYNSRLSIDNF